MEKNTTETCKCGRPASAAEHTCPYREDIHGDKETKCKCCAFCEGQCKDDI